MGESSKSRVEKLFKLSTSDALQGGKFKDFIAELLPELCFSLNASKASFWLYRSEEDEFESIQEFDTKSNELISGRVIDQGHYKTLLSKVKKENFLLIEAGDESLEHEEFVLDFLLKNRFKNWASLQVWNSGRLFGIISLSWQANKDFTEADQLILLAGSGMVSQCYDALLRLKEDFLHQNELRTLKLEGKEKEKLAKKLSDHAFYTSHTIRHPLSTILALIDLIKLNWESREMYEELLQQLKIETMNLDDAIRVMTTKIELD